MQLKSLKATSKTGLYSINSLPCVTNLSCFGRSESIIRFLKSLINRILSCVGNCTKSLTSPVFHRNPHRCLIPTDILLKWKQ